MEEPIKSSSGTNSSTAFWESPCSSKESPTSPKNDISLFELFEVYLPPLLHTQPENNLLTFNIF